MNSASLRRGGVLAAGLIGLAGAAAAQPVTGPYVGIGGGYNYRQDVQTKNQVVSPPDALTNLDLFEQASGGNNGKVGSADGFVGLGSIGYGFGNGLRVEIEGNYRQTEFRRFTGTLEPYQAGGDYRTYGGMVNVLYDFDPALVGLDLPVYPYIGAGGGVGVTDLNKAYAVGQTAAGADLYSFNGTDSEFAYQGIAGVALPLPILPGLSFTAEYRFYGIFGTTNIPGSHTFNNLSSGNGFQEIDATPLRLRDQYNHSVLGGLRYAFYQPAPPPPPPPPPPAEPPVQPTKSYLVFFDWDKATLTERARQIIHEAADNSTHVQYTRIEVNGYTDTSGTPKYNQGLSVRRAQAVAAELVRDGVPRQSISIQGFGETHLLVPTGPGVREPQNRRVEIIIQ